MPVNENAYFCHKHNIVRFIYNILISLAGFALQIISFFSPKLKLFVTGRKETFKVLKEKLSPSDDTIWMHVASLGEYEQGLPIIEQLKTDYPDYKIVITFFSPSGYEVKKDAKIADVVCYLPLDSTVNAKKFIALTKPKIALFIKYEIWPNILSELKTSEIPTVLVSALFKKNQIFFTSYGGFMRNALTHFEHIFVQDQNSIQLLNSIQITNTSISGDTRLDRVSEILERDNKLPFMSSFKNDTLCLVAGSTWPEDEEILINYINKTKLNFKTVIAPHTIKADKVVTLAKAFTKKTILYSDLKNQKLEDFDILIIDTIGLLTKIYSYADVAYVGGAFATGLHNTMEPAVFGIPIIIGPEFSGFKEAEDLVEAKGILTLKNQLEFDNVFDSCFTDAIFRKETGAINFNYIKKNKGASAQILTYINSLLQ